MVVKFSTALIFGNFKEVYNHLNSLGISEEISSDIELSEKLIKNFSFKQNLKEKIQN